MVSRAYVHGHPQSGLHESRTFRFQEVGRQLFNVGIKLAPNIICVRINNLKRWRRRLSTWEESRINVGSLSALAF